MLAAEMRLRSTRDITAVFKHGVRIRTPYVFVHALPKPSQATSRVACVVGTRVSRSAVVRHRYQRWLREAARRAIQEAFVSNPHDLVWVALPGIAAAGSAIELCETVLPPVKKYALSTKSV